MFLPTVGSLRQAGVSRADWNASERRQDSSMFQEGNLIWITVETRRLLRACIIYNGKWRPDSQTASSILRWKHWISHLICGRSDIRLIRPGHVGGHTHQNMTSSPEKTNERKRVLRIFPINGKPGGVSWILQTCSRYRSRLDKGTQNLGVTG